MDNWTQPTAPDVKRIPLQAVRAQRRRVEHRTLQNSTTGDPAARDGRLSALPEMSDEGNEHWRKGQGEEGLRFWSGWLQPDEAHTAFAAVNSDSFPWNLKPVLYGESLRQHAYTYRRKEGGGGGGELGPGLQALEGLCARISAEFECQVSTVFCNRFMDPDHCIAWHRDTYGSHIFVLSLGGSRGLEYCSDATQEVTRYDPAAGDLYFMSLQYNKLHTHRVLADESSGSGTRVSFVFFATAPCNLKQYRIGLGDQLYGAWNAMLA